MRKCRYILIFRHTFNWVMRKWFDFSKNEIVRLFIIRINGGFFSNYFPFWKVELFPVLVGTISTIPFNCIIEQINIFRYFSSVTTLPASLVMVIYYCNNF